MGVITEIFGNYYRLYFNSDNRDSGTQQLPQFVLNYPSGTGKKQARYCRALLREMYYNDKYEETPCYLMYWSVPMPNQLYTGEPSPMILGTFKNKQYDNGLGTAGGLGAIFQPFGSVKDGGQLCANPFGQLVSFEVRDADGGLVDPEGRWSWTIDLELKEW